MKNVIFVCLSHTLTEPQIAELNERFDNPRIVLIKDVNPELAANAAQVNPDATVAEIQTLAASIVAEACKVEATHFILQGEPRLQTWANLMAGRSEFTYLNHEEVLTEGYNFKHLLPNSLVKGGSIVMKCLVATSARESFDVVQPDGSIKKQANFKHHHWADVF
jgi:hypothetical protein